MRAVTKSLLLLPFLLLLPALAWAQGPPPVTKTFAWTASVADATHDAPTSYAVGCGNTSGGPYPVAIPVTGSPLPTSTTWTVTAPGTWFCVVTAANASGTSGPSNEVTFRWAPPGAPSGLTVR